MIAFPTHAVADNNNIMPTEVVYYGGSHGSEFVNMQNMKHLANIRNNTMVTPQVRTAAFAAPNVIQNPGQVMSGIDSRYLAAYSESSPSFMVTGQVRNDPNPIPVDPRFGNDYQNYVFNEADKNRHMSVGISPHLTAGQVLNDSNPVEPRYGNDYQDSTFNGADKNRNKSVTFSPHLTTGQQMWNDRDPVPVDPRFGNDYKNRAYNGADRNRNKSVTFSPQLIAESNKKPATNMDPLKTEPPVQIASRFDRLKILYKSGPRVFSGPVEKILKWHKALQDIGILIIYETVAKCVSVRAGESCAKNLVVRDDNGPAMQVVYYEIDFLLPDLKPPCTVRVIGRMIAGTNRLLAFNVRPANGDDVSILPRRAAVAAHHVAKLCKEYIRQ